MAASQNQDLLHTDKDREHAILEVIERFRTGWETGSAERVLSTVAQKDDMVMYGTDLAERWIGYDSMVEPTHAMVDAFENPRYTWGEGEPMVWVRGDTGWACGDLTIHMDTGGKKVIVRMRSTFVVVRENGNWKIAHSHFSIGQEEPAAEYG